MAPFSYTLKREIEKQVVADPEAVQRIVREVYAEVFGEEELDTKIAKMGIDVSRYGVRPVYEYIDKKPTGAVVGHVEYQKRDDNDSLYFKIPTKEQYEALTLAFCTPERGIGRIPARDVIETKEGTVHRSEAVSRASDHLRMMEDYLVSLVGKRKATKWVREQQQSLVALINSSK